MHLIEKETLAEALSGFRLLKRAKGRSAEPLAVTVTRDSEALCLTASRLNHTLTHRCPVDSSAYAETFTVPFSTLEEAARAADKGSGVALEPGTVRYRVKGVIVQATFNAATQQPDASVEESAGESLTLPPEVMGAIAEASACASTLESREVLNGVHIGLDRLAATDGRRLYTKTIKPLPLSEDGIILPVHPLLKLFVNDSEVALRLAPPPATVGGLRRFELHQGPWSWSGFLVRGAYPNYRQVMPRENEIRQWVDLSDRDSLRILEVLPKLPGGKEKDSPVRLEMKDGRAALLVGINGSASEVPLSESSLRGEKKPETVTFNRDFLLEALRQGFRSLGVKDRFAPVVMEDPQASRIHLWMPLRTESVEAGPPQEEAPPAAPERPVPEETKPTARIERIHPQPTETMHDTQPATEPRDPVEALLEDIQTVRDSLKETVTRMNGLVPLVRQVARENKGMERELNKARSSFASLERSVKALSQIAV